MMRHECKVTVIDKKCFVDFQEQYLADKKSFLQCRGYFSFKAHT